MRWAAAFLLLFTAAPVAAASFDCRKAASPFEKTVCADPALSRADSALAAAYARDRAALSPEGQATLLASQRSWLAYAIARCRPGGRPLDDWMWDPRPGQNDRSALCLESVYKERFELLATGTLVRFGGRTFFYTTTYAVRNLDPSDNRYQEHKTDQVHRMIQSVRFDRPTSPAEAAWNAHMAKVQREDLAYLAHGDDPVGPHDNVDVYVTPNLFAAGPDLIVADDEVDATPKGEEHHYPTPATWAWSLKLGRALEAGDVFDDRKPWRRALVAAVRAGLKREQAQTDEDVAKAALDVRGWAPLHKGLRVQFGEYEVASYRIPPDPVVVNWEALKPWLNPAMAERLRGLEDAPYS